jgi:hypothetical protein
VSTISSYVCASAASATRQARRFHRSYEKHRRFETVEHGETTYCTLRHCSAWHSVHGVNAGPLLPRACLPPSLSSRFFPPHSFSPPAPPSFTPRPTRHTPQAPRGPCATVCANGWYCGALLLVLSYIPVHSCSRARRGARGVAHSLVPGLFPQRHAGAHAAALRCPRRPLALRASFHRINPATFRLFCMLHTLQCAPTPHPRAAAAHVPHHTPPRAPQRAGAQVLTAVRGAVLLLPRRQATRQAHPAHLAAHALR